MSITLEVSRAGDRADVRIELPPVNVLDRSALADLARAVRASEGARVLVLSGRGRAFSAGVSVPDHVPEPERIREMLGAMRDVLEAVVRAPAVTIASVSGACLGGGAEIAAACDFVLVTEDARVGFPEIRLACFPPGAIALLPLRVGPQRAAEWILTGRTLSGREAAASGFASRACAPGDLRSATDRLAADLSALSPAALAAARDLLRAPRRAALERVLPLAEAAYEKLAGNEDLARMVREWGSGS